MITPGPVNTHSAEHYVWGQVCDGWKLLNRSDLSVIEERVPPGASEVRHVHAKARQFFYILKGTACLEMNGVEHVLNTGDGLEVPPEMPHRFKNTSNVEVVFLVVSAPSTQGDRTNLA